MKRFLRPQDLVEPQHTEGYVEGRWTVSSGSFVFGWTIPSLLNTIRNKVCLGEILNAHFQEAHKYRRSSEKATSDNATVHPEFNDLDRSAKLSIRYLKVWIFGKGSWMLVTAD